jgi:PD-(D/E)XK nuclease superfamily
VEWTSVAKIRVIHAAQRLTCMKWAGVKIGRLTNFNATKLKDGIQRFVV